MRGPLKSKLPRLPREFYRGHAAVLWTHTLEQRARGWLGGRFHASFREAMIHACARSDLACPSYVLMPDHWHLVWMGTSDESDQLAATAFLRRHVAPLLGAARLQDRAHDHVLREREPERGAFMAACAYVLENPARGDLCRAWRDWPHAGAIVPGYPRLNPRAEGFWDDFWRLYYRLTWKETGQLPLSVARRGSGGIPPLPGRATEESS